MSLAISRTLLRNSKQTLFNQKCAATSLLSCHRPLHTTSKTNFKIPLLPMLPQAPGGVTGDVNVASPIIPMSKAHGSYHWWLERSVELSVVPLVTAAFVTGGNLPAFWDGLMAFSVMAHCGLELQSCIDDYVSKRVYGKWHDYCIYLLLGGSALGTYGIIEAERKDIGISKTIKGLFFSTADPATDATEKK